MQLPNSFTLSHAQQQQLLEDEQEKCSHNNRHRLGLDEQQKTRHDNEQQHLSAGECPLCYRPYGAKFGAHFPVVLPCDHDVGAACLKEYLKDTKDCFHCGATVLKIPAATTTFTNPGHEVTGH